MNDVTLNPATYGGLFEEKCGGIRFLKHASAMSDHQFAQQ
jgi:hypothetical protein